MEKVKATVDIEEVLNNVGLKRTISHFGITDVANEIPVRTYLDCADIDEALKEIDNMHPDKIEEYLKEKHSD